MKSNVNYMLKNTFNYNHCNAICKNNVCCTSKDRNVDLHNDISLR